MEVGRVCIKKYGRDAGSRAVVMKVLENGFVSIVTTIRPKERRCNSSHLEFLNEKIDVKSAEAVEKALGIKHRAESKATEERPAKGRTKR